MQNKVIVVGAGAAGMMAAIAAAESGAEVVLLERNDRVGKKLRITGKGRCNVTNNKDTNAHIAAFRHNGKFMYAALNRWKVEDVKNFFESNGVPLKVERGERVFPQSDNGQDIVDALKRKLDQLGVNICFQARVHSLLRSEKRVLGVLLENGEKIYGDSVIIATGGQSYTGTGSTGDGYRLARTVGHKIVEPRAALVPVNVREKDVALLQGLSLRNVEVRIYDKNGKMLDSEFGELMFTHFGLSGPVILTLSATASDWWQKNQGDLIADIDLKPALSREKLDARLLREIKEQPSRIYKNLLGALLPQKLIEPFMARSGIDGKKVSNQLTREDREVIIDLLKGFWFTLSGTRDLNEAIVTAGGVDVREISPKTMGSKLCDNLFFCGEVMDVDAITGGYNLQAAFSSGYVAGCAAAECGGAI